MSSADRAPLDRPHDRRPDGPDAAGPEPPGSRRTFGRPTAAWPPPGDAAPAPRRRERRVLPSTIMIIATVLIMIVGLVLIPFIPDSLVERLTPREPGPTAPLDPGDRNDGGSGVGDPYYPDYGNSGYDAQRYTISLRWIPQNSTLTGSTVITAPSTQRLRSFFVDLVLPVKKVSVNGEDARFERRSRTDVKIIPERPIAADTGFAVTISYGGRPAAYRIGNQTPWWVSGEEVTVAGEPEGAAWWFPSNDHPSDPAAFDVTVRVPAGMEVISNGRLVGRQRQQQDDTDTWRWVCDQTMSTYQAFIAIGQYSLRQGTADGMPYVYAVSNRVPAEQRRRAFSQLTRSAAVIKDLEQLWGPYPYRQLGGVVPSHQLWFAGLETATRPVYAADAITDGGATDLITHELAHMWFGDRVTLAQWNDIFNSEAYASFSEWLRTERAGGPSADDALHARYDRLKDDRAFWSVTMADPGRDHLFDAVYSRGPMTLQALRNVMGDRDFFRFSRDWARGGTESLEDWMAAARTYTAADLDPFFAAWIYGRTAPAATAANGLA